MPPHSPAQTASTSPTTSTPTLTTITQDSSIVSPDLTSRFSQADTLLTQESNYTANTGGRARQSWRDRNLTRLDSFLSNDSEKRSSRRISLPNDTSSEIPTLIIPQQLLQPPMSELPATPVAQPDEPQSFFDSDSGSEGSSRSGHRDTIISRASSVRVGRPQIIEHTHTASGLHRSHSPMIHEASEFLPSGSLSKAQQILGSELRSLTLEQPDATKAGSNFIPLSTSSPRTTTAATEGKLKTKSRSKLSLANPDIEAGSASASASVQASTTAPPPTTPTLETDTETTSASSIRQTILEVPDTPSDAEALDILPTPLGGFGSLHLNPLHSNPTNSQLHRAISAPPLRFTPVIPIVAAARANRKVTIRPSDLVITDTKGHHRLFRESVVSTPYPSRHESIRRQEQELADALSAHTLSARSPATLQSDRFPSPLRGQERLFLRLALARREGAEVQIEIEVKDRSKFDDAALFAQIRAGCTRRLLGWIRRGFTARKLAHVSVNARQEESFDAADFLKHLQTSKLGHRRKGWIVWLRAHQQQAGEKHADATTPGSTTLGRMPFSTTTYAPIHKQNTVPQVTLHYRFSALRIVAAAIMLILASVIATVLWVLVGPSPVLQAGDGGFGGVGWRIEPQARVLTGLVLGLVVYLLGGVGFGAWVWWSWVLL